MNFRSMLFAALDQRHMRKLIAIFLLIACAALIDEVKFDGRYRELVIQDAKQQGQKFNRQIDVLLRRLRF